MAIIVHGYGEEGKLTSRKALYFYTRGNYEITNYLSTSSFPIITFTNIATELRAEYSLKNASAINAVKKSKISILYIHGDSDNFVPIFMMNELYNSTSSKKKKVTIKGGKHANSDLAQSHLYRSSISKYLKEYIKE